MEEEEHLMMGGTEHGYENNEGNAIGNSSAN